MNEAGAVFDGKHFQNPVPTNVMVPGTMPAVLRDMMRNHPGRVPDKPLGPFQATKNALAEAAADQVYVTWLGHSTVLMSINGKRFLTDPVWYQRVSPFTKVGPKRFFQVPVALTDLPALDFVLLSHDHYDHLDLHAIRFLAQQNVPIITMLGVGKRLRAIGVPDQLISELDWWQEKDLGDDFKLTALPARHFSGRSLVDRFTTLWGSFAIAGPRHTVYYGADSGYYEGFKKIGERFGSFDLTLLEIGAYNAYWPDIHMGPENAIKAQRDLRGNMLLPIHWGTFALATHPWKEPVERLIPEAQKHNVKLMVPAPGETRVLTSETYINPWWNR